MKRRLVRLDKGMKIPFGKYKGTVMELLINRDLGYAKWLWYENISPMTDRLDEYIERRLEEEEDHNMRINFNSIIRDELRGMTLDDIL